jgi:hypothetical protein
VARVGWGGNNQEISPFFCTPKTAEFALLHAPLSTRLDGISWAWVSQSEPIFGPFGPPGRPRGPLPPSNCAKISWGCPYRERLRKSSPPAPPHTPTPHTPHPSPLHRRRAPPVHYGGVFRGASPRSQRFFRRDDALRIQYPEIEAQLQAAQPFILARTETEP